MLRARFLAATAGLKDRPCRASCPYRLQKQILCRYLNGPAPQLLDQNDDDPLRPWATETYIKPIRPITAHSLGTLPPEPAEERVKMVPTQKELEEFMPNLVRFGWTVRSLSRHTEFGWALHMAYKFSDYATMISFVGLVGGVAKDEHHQPKTLSCTDNMLEIELCSTQVTRHPSDELTGRCFTVKDMRFAYRVQRHYLSRIGVTTADLDERYTQVRQHTAYIKSGLLRKAIHYHWHGGQGNLRFSATCSACYNPDHKIDSCPQRHKIPPRHPCSECGEPHWRVDCPHLHKEPTQGFSVHYIDRKMARNENTVPGPPKPITRKIHDVNTTLSEAYRRLAENGDASDVKRYIEHPEQ
ncbi:uncharacterized protein EV420DRAFT_1753311 [Desarmillaria tabescens]|uniref:Uncharacterized protein n=1 Tax=Armillaria tabescens TaxID=1929756 RepID=A0AA39JC56_ARMTA|nr:uncharacterized protein EV420DRAFT_1753311 [Desarmillaria tabescens]KAK0437983.1 hypothetical protein EV420DRAFT_1753311 [Desarmillaria tabescens]